MAAKRKAKGKAPAILRLPERLGSALVPARLLGLLRGRRQAWRCHRLPSMGQGRRCAASDGRWRA